MLSKFQPQFFTDLEPNLLHFGPLLEVKIDQKSLKNHLLGKNLEKSKNLQKPQFLQRFLKVWPCKIIQILMIFNQLFISKIVLNSCCVCFSILVNFNPLLDSFWSLFCTFVASLGASGLVLGAKKKLHIKNWIRREHCKIRVENHIKKQKNSKA